MTLRPLPADEGVVFRRVDLPGGRAGGRDDLAGDPRVVRLTPAAVVDTRLGTTIANAHGVRVQTVEHVLAAILGTGLDNVLVDLEGPEPPAMDGSAGPFAKVIARAGLVHLAAPRRVIRILQPVEITLDGRRARFEPAPRMEIDVTIAFDDPAIGAQRASFSVEPGRGAERFLADVAPARTFAFLSDVEALQAQGLAQGGSLENCIVLDGGKVMNEDGLRYPDEMARHKALDALGDLGLAGRPIVGRYVADRPGHALNNAALRALMDETTAWRLEAGTEPETHRARPAAQLGLRPAAV